MKFGSQSVVAIAAVVAAVVGSSEAAPPARRGAWPSLPASQIKSYSLWSWGPLEKGSSNADLVMLDADLESASTIQSLKSQGKKVVCYISAGTVENWRSDASKFSAVNSDVMAKKYKGFPETWLDITNWESFKGPMGDRINNAASKGCDGVELDNIDCYNNMCVAGASYATLKSKEIEYVRWLAGEAHSKGMAAGMKNAVELIPDLVDTMDFAINEQCQEYGNPKGAECSRYDRFASQNKAVFGVEYENVGGDVCGTAKKDHMLTKYKSGGSWNNCGF